MAFNDPTTIAMDDLEQCNADLTQLGVIAFSKHTVQRKRCSFKVYVNAYWNVPNGTYYDDNNKKRMLRGILLGVFWRIFGFGVERSQARSKNSYN